MSKSRDAAGTALAIALDVLPLVGPRTGVGAFAQGLLQALHAREDVTVVGYAAALGAARARGLLAPGVPLRTWRVPARVLNTLWRRWQVPAGDALAGSADVVHGTNFVVPPCRHAAEVATVHDLWCLRSPELCSPTTRAYPAVVRAQLARGAFVHVHSQFVAAEVVERLGADPERVRVVAPGLGPPQAQPPAAQGRQAQPPAAQGPQAQPPPAERDRDGPAPARPPEPPYVLALGTAEPRKDYLGLVDAFGRLPQRLADVRLVIAGPEGTESEALAKAIAASRAGGRIIRLGYVDAAERGRLLEGASALAYPSIYEGFGLPPLEAMAAGVPVVTTDGGALPEVVGAAALIVPRRDPEALAGGLEEVLTDEALRSSLVALGKDRAGLYSWDRCAGSMVQLYADAALRAPGRRRGGGH